MSIIQEIRAGHLAPTRALAFGKSAVTCAVVAAEALVIVVAASLSGAGYHWAIYGDAGALAGYAALGMLTALLYIVPHAAQGESTARAFLAGGRTLQRIVMRWHVAFLLLAVVGFLTKTTDLVSRGWVVIFFLSGLLGLLRLEIVAGRLFLWALKHGHVRPRRLMLVGSQEDLEVYRVMRGRKAQLNLVVAVTRLDPSQIGVSVASHEALRAGLRSACNDARALGVDDILLLPSARRADILDACIDTFSLLPVSIHLDAFSDIETGGMPTIEPIGSVVALTLVAPPARPVSVIAKRALDIAASAVAIVVFAPLLALIAGLIKLDSAGPVLFRQRRRGYNHREFLIYKFRTMTTLEDGDHIAQACRNDPRITRVGRFLRRWNLDELPQLINVLKGEMSIVGPRPHAVAHDRLFEDRISHYARRLNVKPGITGWAQVNGFRGETDTDEKMRARVAHDLHYIDNWSLPFDLYIIVLTLISPRAFANAR